MTGPAATGMPDDAEEIRALVQAFAAAVAADPFQAATMLCREEREIFEQDVDPNIVLPESPPAVAPIAVSDIVVEGDVASAVTRRPPASVPIRMYFRREGGRWTVCAPVEEIMNPRREP